MSARDLEWADVICVMERKHAQRLRADYERLLGGKPLHGLEVPDEYRYMDPELVALLTQVVSERLGL